MVLILRERDVRVKHVCLLQACWSGSGMHRSPLTCDVAQAMKRATEVRALLVGRWFLAGIPLRPLG